MTSEAKTITGAGTFVTSYGYDAMDRVVTTTYPSGEVVTQTYNAAAQLTTVRSATHNLAYARGMTYNPLGQLTQMTYGNNLATTYTYDSLSARLKRIQTGSLLDLNYGYDAVGNVKSITDTTLSQVQTFTYDALDRLRSVRGAYSEDYDYNAIGNITYTSRLGNYVYPASGITSTRPHAATAAGSNSYTYNNNGNMTQRVENGVMYTQTWDVENRLSSVTVGAQTTTFYYDGDGQRVKQVQGGQTIVYVGNQIELNLSASLVANASFEMAGGTSTDAANWVEGTNHTRSSDRTHSGNWAIKSTYTGAGSATRSDAIPVVPNTTYTMSGWIYKAATTGQAYLDMSDISGELTLVATQTGAWQFVSGRWNSGSNTSVVIRLVTDSNPNGAIWFDDVSLISTTAMTTTYYYAGSTRVAMRQGSSVYYLHGDHLGSASLATTSDGAVYSQQRYYPYGVPRWNSGTLPTDRRFTGQRSEEASLGSLYDFQARQYSPVLGRFLSADTIVPSPGNPQDLNRYAYTRGNPLRFTDPTGHYAFEEDPDDPWSYGTNVRSEHYYTHPDYRAGNQSDAQFLSGAAAPFWAAAAAVGGEVAVEGTAVAGTAGWEALRQAAIHASAKCLLNPVCAAVIYRVIPKPSSSSTQPPLGETLYRFSEPSGQFVRGLKEGEDAVSLARAADFGSPAEAFESLFKHAPGPNAKYLVTNVGTALRSGYLAVYDSTQGGNPYGHVSLYAAEGVKWGERFMSIFFGPAQSVKPGG